MASIDAVVAFQASHEIAVHLRGARVVLQSSEDVEQPANEQLVVGREANGPAAPQGGADEIPRRLRALGKAQGAPLGHVSQAQARCLEPLVELRCLTDEEPLEQVAAVELDGGVRSMRLGGTDEGADVAPQMRRVDSHLLRTSIGYRRSTERSARRVERLPERGARVGLVELGPIQGEQRVPPVEGARRCRGEVGEKREAARLREQLPHLTAGFVREAHAAQKTEFQNVTLRSRLLSPRLVTRLVTRG